MNDMLDAAEKFMKSRSSDREAVQKLIDQTNNAISMARGQVKSAYRVVGGE